MNLSEYLPTLPLINQWRFWYRTLLFVLQSSVCLASSSQSLNRYSIFPNKHLHLASFGAPDSSRGQSGIKRLSQCTGAVFRFYGAMDRNWTCNRLIKIQKLYQLSYLCETHRDVLLQMLHTLLDTEYTTSAYLLPCELLSNSSSLQDHSFLLWNCMLALVREHSNSHTTC